MSSINISLVSSAKAQLVSLPRSMTVADLHKLAPKDVTFSVAGCTPAAASTLGDLYDSCAVNETLEVRFNAVKQMGWQLCLPGCSCGYEGVNEKAMNQAVNNALNDIQNSAQQAAQDATQKVIDDAKNNIKA